MHNHEPSDAELQHDNTLEEVRFDGRLDYLRFLLICSPDECERYRLRLSDYETAAQNQGAQDCKPSIHVHRIAPNGDRTYTLDYSGPMAHVLACLMPLGMWRDVTRVDYRVQLPPECEGGLAAAGDYCDRFGSSGNVVRYNTKGKKKKDGRSTGGRGFASGSHKSDRRLVCYKRATELPALEINLQGDVLKRILVQNLADWESGESTFVDSLFVKLDDQMTALLKRAGFDTLAHLSDVVTGENTGLETGLRESGMHQLARQLSMFSPAEQLSIITAAQSLAPHG